MMHHLECLDSHRQEFGNQGSLLQPLQDRDQNLVLTLESRTTESIRGIARPSDGLSVGP